LLPHPLCPRNSSGHPISRFKALDQHGETQHLGSLAGEKGLLLMFSRSFDWCPFCIRQLNQLVEVSDRFAAMGIGIATITYDPIEFLKEYAEDEEIQFALLHDEKVQHVNAFGILNTDYAPGERAYGIPYPGIFLVDSQGVIRYKFAEESYRIRPDFDDVLTAAAKM
jgi:peroxiredoxin